MKRIYAIEVQKHNIKLYIYNNLDFLNKYDWRF